MPACRYRVGEGRGSAECRGDCHGQPRTDRRTDAQGQLFLFFVCFGMPAFLTPLCTGHESCGIGVGLWRYTIYTVHTIGRSYVIELYLDSTRVYFDSLSWCSFIHDNLHTVADV